MRCRNCGGQLKIEDEKCPYCDTINQDAILHRKNMKKYQKDYEQTKNDLFEETKRMASKNAPLKGRIILNATLLLLCFLLPCFLSVIMVFFETTNITKVSSEEKETFFGYIENEQYIDAGIYYWEGNLWEKDDSYEIGLSQMGNLCQAYSEAYGAILSYAESRNITSKYHDQSKVNEDVIYYINRYYTEKASIQKTYIESEYYDNIYKKEAKILAEKSEKKIIDLIFVVFNLDVTKEEFIEKGINGKLDTIERSIDIQ